MIKSDFSGLSYAENSACLVCDSSDQGILGHRGNHEDSGADIEEVLEGEGVGVLLKDVFADLLPAVGREAVEDDMVRGGALEQSTVDLVGTELRLLAGLSFLAHREPDVGVDHIGIRDGFGGIGSDGDVRGVEPAEEVGRGLARFR